MTNNRGSSGNHTPIRSCAACRDRSPQSELVRLNQDDGKVFIVVNPGMIKGRSVYICPREKCFDALAKSGRIEFARGKYNRLVIRPEQTEWYILKNKFMNFVRERGLAG